MDINQIGHDSMVYNFIFDKKFKRSHKTTVGIIENKTTSNQQQAYELYELFIRKFKKIIVYSSFKDNACHAKQLKIIKRILNLKLGIM